MGHGDSDQVARKSGVSSPVRLGDGSIVIKQIETKIGPVWTGTGRPPIGTYKRPGMARGEIVYSRTLAAPLTDLLSGEFRGQTRSSSCAFIDRKEPQWRT